MKRIPVMLALTLAACTPDQVSDVGGEATQRFSELSVSSGNVHLTAPEGQTVLRVQAVGDLDADGFDDLFVVTGTDLGTFNTNHRRQISNATVWLVKGGLADGEYALEEVPRLGKLVHDRYGAADAVRVDHAPSGRSRLAISGGSTVHLVELPITDLNYPGVLSHPQVAAPQTVVKLETDAAGQLVIQAGSQTSTTSAWATTNTTIPSWAAPIGVRSGSVDSPYDVQFTSIGFEYRFREWKNGQWVERHFFDDSANASVTQVEPVPNATSWDTAFVFVRSDIIDFVHIGYGSYYNSVRMACGTPVSSDETPWTSEFEWVSHRDVPELPSHLYRLIGDVNQDGWEDGMLACPGTTTGAMIDYGPLGVGVGGWVIQEPEMLDVHLADARYADRAGDLNGDGADDLAAIGETSVHLFWGGFGGIREAEPVEEAPPLALYQVAPGELVISEVLPDLTTCSDAKGEWVELENRSAKAIDLQGLKLIDAAATAGNVYDSVVVPAGSRVLLGVGSASSWCGSTVPAAFYGSKPALNNTGTETLRIEGGGQVLNSVSYTGSTPGKSHQWRDGQLWANQTPTPGL